MNQTVDVISMAVTVPLLSDVLFGVEDLSLKVDDLRESLVISVETLTG